MKMWGPLFRQQEEVLFGFPSTVFQPLMVFFVCCLMVCSSGHWGSPGVSAGPPRSLPVACGSPPVSQGSLSARGWTNALCPSAGGGEAGAGRVCFLRFMVGQGLPERLTQLRWEVLSTWAEKWTGA